MFSLPVRVGGLNTPNPVLISSREYTASSKVTAALVDAIIHKSGSLDYSIIVDQTNSISEVQKEKRKALTTEVEITATTDMTSEKGSSSWLIALSIVTASPSTKAPSGTPSP